MRDGPATWRPGDPALEQMDQIVIRSWRGGRLTECVLDTLSAKRLGGRIDQVAVVLDGQRLWRVATGMDGVLDLVRRSFIRLGRHGP